jgi:predicted metal-dependent hydrolase
LPLDRAALSVALGRDNVVHLGVIMGRGADRSAAERVEQAHARLQNYRDASQDARETGAV